ncbi:MAG: hypothetical protein KKB21_05455 [Nanoarchaeota archaeon]|nr:hypothetical protein [Nanoarchaeota archaeon]MBU4086993.1 hypothetical protein [Nanoarchaeota archaeon]
MVHKTLSLLVLAIFLVNLASADVLLNQPKAVYNINDMLDVDATVRATLDTDAFVELSLVCGGVSKMFYFSPISLKDAQEERINKKLLLSNSFLNGMLGDCIISARYEDETYSSQNFRISNKINLVLSMDKTIVNPGEKVKVEGSAVKENGQNVQGFVEVSVENALIKTASSVSNGKIELNFSFPDNARSGNYIAKISAYERVGGEITSSAEKEVMLSVKQSPRRIEIASDKQSVVPGQDIKFKPLVYDQAEDLVDGNIKVIVLDEKGNTYLGKVVKSGEEFSIKFEENTSFGYWIIETSAFGLSSTRGFEIEELEKASFEIVNDTLIVKNVGNVPYRKSFVVYIDGHPTNIDHSDLEVGGSRGKRVYVLTGNEAGIHNISIVFDDGAIETSAPLLGGVIGVQELRDQLSAFNKYPIVWVFLILIFGMFVFTLSRRVIKKKYYGYAPSKKEIKGFEKVSGKEEKAVEVKNLQNIKAVREAEPSLVLDGNKEEAGVVVLKVKNLADIGNNKIAMEAVKRAILSITNHKGTINQNHDGYTGIFVPSTTRTFKNDLTAVRVATEIAAHLNEHNSKLKDKIEYGIGINSGELAVKIIDGKLRFTPLGNTTTLAKRVADSADKTVLLTANTNRKIVNDVKTLKQGEYYSVGRIIEREQNKDFLNKFKERNKI